MAARRLAGAGPLRCLRRVHVTEAQTVVGGAAAGAMGGPRSGPARAMRATGVVAAWCWPGPGPGELHGGGLGLATKMLQEVSHVGEVAAGSPRRVCLVMSRCAADAGQGRWRSLVEVCLVEELGEGRDRKAAPEYSAVRRLRWPRGRRSGRI